MKYIFTLIAAILSAYIIAQTPTNDSIRTTEVRIEELARESAHLKEKLEKLKLDKLIEDLKTFGIPKTDNPDQITWHAAMALKYNEEHEQPEWVAHIILPDIKRGGIGRTNDFRTDPAVKSLSAEKDDYWNSGYDRGHLAPSADFRWSETALSESYFYSNMSPQLPDFNRGIWAMLEGSLREYVETKNRQIFVITGGILEKGLPVIGKNAVSIPKTYYKVVADLAPDSARGIAFVIPNERSDYPVLSYAIPIDSVEKLTNIDFFASLPDELEEKIESHVDEKLWFVGHSHGNAKPLNKKQLPSGAINTVQAKTHIDEKATVCGTVVSVKYVEKSGNTFINLDQKFPNQIFWCTVWKSNRINFSYDPVQYLINKKICVTGEIKLKYGQPSMSIKTEENITILE